MYWPNGLNLIYSKGNSLSEALRLIPFNYALHMAARLWNREYVCHAQAVKFRSEGHGAHHAGQGFRPVKVFVRNRVAS